MQGGHARSGPTPDPNSLRGAKRPAGITLPAAGYDGEVPRFPLPDKTYDEGSLREWAWRMPQAAQWAKEPWRWANIALWVRMYIRVATGEAKGGDNAACLRLADEIGLSTSGLKHNSWTISRDEVAEKREEAAPAASARARLRSA